jgi:hypothetical protein
MVRDLLLLDPAVKAKYRNIFLIFSLVSAVGLGIDGHATVLATAWDGFHPVWRPEPIFQHVRELAQDPDHRLEPEFTVPDALLDRVSFWSTVYTQFTSQMKLIHDRRDPGIVYGYLDLTGMSGREATKTEIAVRRKLIAAIHNLAGENVVSPLSSSDLKLLRRYLSKHHVHSNDQLMDLIPNIRTQSGQKDAFQVALRRAQNYLPSIRQFFFEQGLPRSLAAIPFVESSFDEKALSKCGAVGIWQFMPWTARAMIDGRDKKRWADTIFQTKAAAQLLREYRKSLPDWGTAVTSYNSGIGRVRRMLQDNDLNSFSGLVRLSEDEGGLGFAGQNYFSELLAANLVTSYQNEFFAGTVTTENPMTLIVQTERADTACWKTSVLSTPIDRKVTVPEPIPTLASFEISYPWIKKKICEVSDALIATIGSVTSVN